MSRLGFFFLAATGIIIDLAASFVLVLYVHLAYQFRLDVFNVIYSPILVYKLASF